MNMNTEMCVHASVVCTFSYSPSSSKATNRDTFVHLYPSVIWRAAMCKLQKPLILQFRSLLSLAFHSHQSAAAVNVFQREFMSTSMPLSFCLLLEPLENSPPKVLGNALHQSHTNERHYTLQSVWFKDDLHSFSSAEGNETLPRDKLRIHLQYSKDIKGFKLCIGFIGGVRTTRKGFY